MVYVVEEGVDKVGRVAVRGKLGAREVADGLADSACDHDACNEKHDIGTSREEERKHAIPVEDVRNGNVKGRDAGLYHVSPSPFAHSTYTSQLTTTSVPIKAEGAA